MKVNDVPQDNTVEYYEGVKRACYAVNDEGKYVIVPSSGWEAEEFINALAVKELAENLEKTRKAVLAGAKSPLAYHMERRQMIPEILGKTAGIAVFRVRRHLRPRIFSRLKSSLLERYAKALAVTIEELKTVPQN
ncbi:hypothetical protein ASZ90_006903 [hydrocarbon metagenome]|uniref:HTH cro/C1-type domain-containing protein n=1 Tax=hydrocarbon metagenome TaxID=938273 RepID=A0A0W8FQP0_9ZZZZ